MAATKQLFVLRHVKSSWDETGLEDHERPLAPRGRRAVKALGEHFRSEGIAPALILCSSAVRTRETLAGSGLEGESVIEDELYAASPGQVLERLNRLPAELRSAMVIGHNPAMQVLVLRLAASGAASELDGSGLLEVQRKFPTGALATLEFEGAWSELAPGRARLTAYIRPKQLTAR
jgi:phosphohistidine phosphatase